MPSTVLVVRLKESHTKYKMHLCSFFYFKIHIQRDASYLVAYPIYAGGNTIHQLTMVNLMISGPSGIVQIKFYLNFVLLALESHNRRLF